MVAFLLIFALMLNLTDCLYIHTVQTFQDLRQQGQKGPAVAFTALLSKHTDVSSRAVVKYDRILSNVGGAYHPSTGIFTAPYKGVYSISCSLMSNLSNNVHLQITKNGAKLSILYSAKDTNPLAGQTLQLLLNKGDKIWIQNNNAKVAKLHDHGSYNMFSGALITRM
ncbi:complement C1q tumor necrosis factor-related protein 3-like [Crassostrea virginica]